MRGLSSWLVVLAGLIVLAFASACGTIATPEWAAEAQETQAALAATDTHLTAIAPTTTPSPVPPTETPAPPTATTAPATATAIPATAVPATAVPATAVPATATVPPQEPLPPAGDPAVGATTFTTLFTFPDNTQWACASCHSVTPDELRLIGPGLFNVSVRAETYPPESVDPAFDTGNHVTDYIHTSIVNPQHFIAPTRAGEAAWALNMPVGFGDLLTDDQIEGLIAYLMTLK